MLFGAWLIVAMLMFRAWGAMAILALIVLAVLAVPGGVFAFATSLDSASPNAGEIGLGAQIYLWFLLALFGGVALRSRA